MSSCVSVSEQNYTYVRACACTYVYARVRTHSHAHACKYERLFQTYAYDIYVCCLNLKLENRFVAQYRSCRWSIDVTPSTGVPERS